MFNTLKSLSIIITTFGSVAAGNLIFINSANAFSVTFDNSGFESNLNSDVNNNPKNTWNTIGDVTNTGNVNTGSGNVADYIQPTQGSNQAVITTGYTPGDYAAPIFNRNDDNGLNFNQSGTQPVSADTNPDADVLQDFLSLDTNALSIDRSISNSPLGDFRTSKEGSGMFQEFDVTLGAGETSFTVSFDWAFSSNDGTTDLGGDQDFAFWSLGQIDGNGSYTSVFNGSEDGIDDAFDTNEIFVLRSSGEDDTNTITPATTADDYIYSYDYPGANNINSTNNANTRQFYTVSGLTPGQNYTYQIGFGVVDVDGLDRTSALLIDNVEVIPFEFSPTFGLAFVASIFGLTHLRRKLQSDAEAQ